MMCLLLFFAGAACVGALANVISLWSWHRMSDVHWTARARGMQVARVAHAQAQWFLPISVAMVLAAYPRDGCHPMFAATGAFFGILLSGRLIDRAAFPQWGFGRWLGFCTSQIAQRMVHGLALGTGMVLMPQPLDARAAWIVVGYLAVCAVLVGGVSNMLWRRIGCVRPASPRLTALVQETAAQAGVSVKAVWELNVPVDYAAALVVTRELVFSRSMVADFGDEELRAICLHELAHLREPRWITAVRALAGPVSHVPLLFLGPVFWSDWRPMVFGPVLAMIGIQRLYAQLSVRLEKAADRYAVEKTPEPAVYARALERMHQRNLIPVVTRKSGARTHPDVYDRMEAVGVTPDYPRPEPPEASNMVSTCWHVVLILAVAVTAFSSLV